MPFPISYLNEQTMSVSRLAAGCSKSTLCDYLCFEAAASCQEKIALAVFDPAYEVDILKKLRDVNKASASRMREAPVQVEQLDQLSRYHYQCCEVLDRRKLLIGHIEIVWPVYP